MIPPPPWTHLPHTLSPTLRPSALFLNRRRGSNCPDRICTQSRCSRYGLSCVAAVGFSGEGQRHRNLQAVGAVEIVVVEPPGRLGPREVGTGTAPVLRSEEHTTELQSLMRLSYAVLRLNKKK